MSGGVGEPDERNGDALAIGVRPPRAGVQEWGEQRREPWRDLGRNGERQRSVQHDRHDRAGAPRCRRLKTPICFHKSGGFQLPLNRVKSHHTSEAGALPGTDERSPPARAARAGFARGGSPFAQKPLKLVEQPPHGGNEAL